MTSPDPIKDHLLTPQNCALLIIDEVFPVVDAVGGTSPVAHRAALERIVQVGGQPVTWTQLICELQRDWARQITAPAFAEVLFAVEGN